MEYMTKAAQLQQLTPRELVAWAGATIVQRGQNYQRSGRVQHLALTPDGALVARVYGTERYATMVDCDEHGPVAVCTCPYEDVCKHAFGEQLLDAAHRMVEFIHDEGEAMGAVAECLDVVFAAMSQTSLPPAEQMLRVIDLELQDQYDMTAGAQVFWEQPHDPAAWSVRAANKRKRRLMETLDRLEETLR